MHTFKSFSSHRHHLSSLLYSALLLHTLFRSLIDSPTPSNFSSLLSSLLKGKFNVMGHLKGSALVGTKYKHPFYERESEIVIGGDYITTESGMLMDIYFLMFYLPSFYLSLFPSFYFPLSLPLFPFLPLTLTLSPPLLFFIHCHDIHLTPLSPSLSFYRYRISTHRTRPRPRRLHYRIKIWSTPSISG